MGANGRGGKGSRFGSNLATVETLPLPPGSPAIAEFARVRGLSYDAHPDETWFRRWEPHDTIAPPGAFFNACTWVTNPGMLVLVEPWYAAPDLEPLERAVMAFAVHPGIRRRAAMRVGDYFLQRVAYLESPPPPTVKIGDRTWDEHVVTLAASPSEAASAFHPSLRGLLAGRGFKGHLELRAGGLVCYYGRLQPTFEGYDRLLNIVREIVNTAISR